MAGTEIIRTLYRHIVDTLPMGGRCQGFFALLDCPGLFYRWRDPATALGRLTDLRMVRTMPASR